MGGLYAKFFPTIEPKKPVKGIGPRLKNIAITHYRGLLGVLVPICALSWQWQDKKFAVAVRLMWLLISWFFLLQPVNIPATSLIPIFVLPLAGVMSTIEVLKCYISEGIMLFLLGSMVLLLLNNTGVDQRISLSILCSGKGFSTTRLLFKCSTAAFVLSMFSNRLIVTSNLMKYVAPLFLNMQSATLSSKDEANYNSLRYIFCNAIHTSSSIGSIVIVHAAIGTLAFRAIFYASPLVVYEYPDIFNYFQYTAYALPVGLLMFFLNLVYNLILLKIVVKKPVDPVSSSIIRLNLLKNKNSIPKKITPHEILSVIFTFLLMATFLFRWNQEILKMGWADFSKNKQAPEIPGVKDATAAAFFVLILHLLPKGIGFLKICTAKKKSDLPPIKPASAILWWRFVDKNLIYSYMFMIGCGGVLTVSAQRSSLTNIISEYGRFITGQTWELSILIVCLVTVVLSNVMPGIAALVIWLPFVLNMIRAPFAPVIWLNRLYLSALGVGVGSSFGFMCPFLNTPAYFCHHTGKVPKIIMAKYAIGSVIVCLIVLWLSLCFWAPLLWDPNNVGIKPKSTLHVLI